MTVRHLKAQDCNAAIALYAHLVGDGAVADTSAFEALVAHPGTTLFGAFDLDQLVSLATIHILPNMTQGGRPYALIENVVTHPDHRGAGHGKRVLRAMIDAAWAADCYKIMLLTGKTADARGFYEKLGFGADEKWGMTIRRVPVR